MARQYLENGQLIDMTPAEEAARDIKDAAGAARTLAAALVDGFMAEVIVRVSGHVPEWDDRETIKMVRSLWPALEPHAPPAWILARDTYLYALASIAKVRGLDAAALAQVDPALDSPFGAVEPADPGWPT